MNDYIKQDRQKRLKGKLLTIVFILLVFIICLLCYYIYLKTDISNPVEIAKDPVTIARMSQTVEEIKQNDLTISEVIQNVNEKGRFCWIKTWILWE